MSPWCSGICGPRARNNWLRQFQVKMKMWRRRGRLGNPGARKTQNQPLLPGSPYLDPQEGITLNPTCTSPLNLSPTHTHACTPKHTHIHTHLIFGSTLRTLPPGDLTFRGRKRKDYFWIRWETPFLGTRPRQKKQEGAKPGANQGRAPLPGFILPLQAGVQPKLWKCQQKRNI